MHPNVSMGSDQQRRVRKFADKSDAYAFFNVLTGAQWLDKVESLLPVHRERQYPPTETLAMFIAQVLSADGSCQSVVDDRAVKRVSAGLRPGSTRTGAYCRARERLPEQMVSELTRYIGSEICAHTPHVWHWRGRPVRLVDGTTVTMADTAANQDAYPQPQHQEPGLGFPICRMLGIVCLGTGALLNAAIGRYHGKGGDEQTLLREILDTLDRDDVLVGDANFATYFLLCTLSERGIDAVFEQFGARRHLTDFRYGTRLGERDHLIELSKPLIKPQWMSQADYHSAPDTLTVREVRAGGKTLITTLLEANHTAKSELHSLYKSRWHVELDLRNIKTTLGMDRLRCKSPEMVHTEVWVYLLAYNLIRVMMAQAAQLNHCSPRDLSFKHTIQIWIAWTHYRHSIDEQDKLGALFVLIGERRVALRPGRIEPRAIKTRPKPYPRLSQTRTLARAYVRKYGHPKKLK